MKENDATVEEKPSTHKQKVQLWMWATIGSIFLFLLFLTVWGIVTREDSNNTDREEIAPSVQFTDPAAIQSTDPADAFSGIQTNYDPATGRPRVQSSSDPFDPQSNQQGQGSQSVGQYLDQVADNVSGKNKPQKVEKTPMQQAIEQWQIQEELRGLNSGKVAFSFGEDSQAKQPQQNISSGQRRNNELGNRLDQLEARRLDVKQKIEQAEQLRDQLLNNQANPEDALRQLSSLGGDFKKPPSDIADYTKENSYEADIEGKIKMPPGTVINAIFTQKTVSDYSNSIVKGMVTHDVYDVDRQFVLMPKGTEIILKSLSISNVNEPIQARMGFVVKWAVLPNGRKVDFSKAFFADREGVGAIKDKVNRHLFAQFMGVAAYALLSSETSREGSGLISDSDYEGEVGKSVREQFAPLAAKYLNLVPTITIRNGQTFKLILEDEIFVDPWKDIYETYYN